MVRDLHMLIRWHDIDHAWLQWFFRGNDAHWQGCVARQYLMQMTRMRGIEVLREHQWRRKISRQRGDQPRQGFDSPRRGAYDNETIESWLRGESVLRILHRLSPFLALSALHLIICTGKCACTSG